MDVSRDIDPGAVLQGFIKAHKTQRAAAAALGISTAYLNDLVHARRSFSRQMLVRLGLRPIIVSDRRDVS